MCRWTLLVAAASATSAGLTQLINAFGRIKWYKIEFSILYLGCLLAGWLLFRSGYPAFSIIVCFVAADLLSRVIQLILLRVQFGFDVRRFLREAYLRPAVAALLLVGWLFLYKLLPMDTAGLKLAGIVLTGIVTAVVLVLVGLKPAERKEIRRFLGRKRHEWELDHRYERVESAHGRNGSERSWTWTIPATSTRRSSG